MRAWFYLYSFNLRLRNIGFHHHLMRYSSYRIYSSSLDKRPECNEKEFLFIASGFLTKRTIKFQSKSKKVIQKIEVNTTEKKSKIEPSEPMTEHPALRVPRAGIRLTVHRPLQYVYRFYRGWNLTRSSQPEPKKSNDFKNFWKIEFFKLWINFSYKIGKKINKIKKIPECD